MAKESNTGKEFIIGGVVLAVICGGLGIYTLTEQSTRYKVDTRIQEKKVQIQTLEKADALLSSMKGDYMITPVKVGTQAYDVFGAPVLWIKPNTTAPIDIMAGAPIHGDVPNAWFIENGLADVLRFSDALTRDSDGDGFSNEEEYIAKTHPSDPENFPLLVDKLASQLHATGFRVIFSSDLGPEFGFKATDPQGNPRWAENAVKIGTSFGKGAEAGRLTLKSVDEREVDMHGAKEKVKFAILEDSKSAPVGEIYEVQVGSKNSALIVDVSATLTVNAGPQAGESIKVKKGTEFALPGQPKEKYIVESIDRSKKSIVIKSAKEGSSQTWTLSEKK